MHKISVTYKAPKGDSKVVEIWGHTFYDGKPEELEVDDDRLAQIKQNRFFEVSGGEGAQEPKHDPKPHDIHDTKHKGR